MYRVLLTSFSASYTEKWEADSPREAEQKARESWQRRFGDAGGFSFHASKLTPRYDEDEEDR